MAPHTALILLLLQNYVDILYDMNRLETENLLHETFGTSAFYGEKWQTIERIFNNENVFLIEDVQSPVIMNMYSHL
jgi:hypothetical protein